MKKIFVLLLIVMLISAAVVIIVKVSSSNRIKDDQSTLKVQDYWPTDGWRSSAPEEQGMDSGILADMLNSVKESGKSINSITIIRNGYLVNEAYFYPYQKGMKHFMNSGTKSIVSALVGMAIDEGYINGAEDKVLDYFPEMEIAHIDERKKALEVKDLLSMTTGLEWEFNNNASTNEMLQSPDWTQFTLNRPMREEPGNTFNYCNGAPHLLSAILQRKTGKSMADYAADKFKQMGITDIFWNSSPENVTTGYTGLYMHPDDAAKIGYLYLNKGNWDGKQLISESWIEASTKQTIQADWNPILPGYGYLWWIPRFGGYAAFGQGGDYIFVVPELNLVVVFTGGIYNVNDIFYPADLMEQFIIPAVKAEAPLPSDPTALEALNNITDVIQEAPASKDTAALPEIAGRISGKTYAMDNSAQLSLEFTDNRECSLYLNSELIFIAGLDQVYRIVESGNIATSLVQSLFGGIPKPNHIAAKGSWLNDNTLQIDIRCPEEGLEVVYTFDFNGDELELKDSSNLYSEMTVAGKIMK